MSPYRTAHDSSCCTGRAKATGPISRICLRIVVDEFFQATSITRSANWAYRRYRSAQTHEEACAHVLWSDGQLTGRRSTTKIPPRMSPSRCPETSCGARCGRARCSNLAKSGCLYAACASARALPGRGTADFSQRAQLTFPACHLQGNAVMTMDPASQNPALHAGHRHRHCRQTGFDVKRIEAGRQTARPGWPLAAAHGLSAASNGISRQNLHVASAGTSDGVRKSTGSVTADIVQACIDHAGHPFPHQVETVY